MKRRTFLTTSLTTAALVGCTGHQISPFISSAAPDASSLGVSRAEPREVQIVHSKLGPLAIMRQQNRLEEAISGTGYSIRWREFAAGPQQLEALNAGSLDIASTAESPVIFAQAAGTPLVYLSTSVPRPKGTAFLTPRGSSIQSIADFKGKRVAFQRASIAHYILIKALKEVGLSLDDIRPTHLPPPEANVAFSQAQIDAWVIWEPYIGRIEQLGEGKVLRFGEELIDVGNFYSAHRNFALEHPEFVKIFLEEVHKVEQWANDNPREQAELLSEETKIDTDLLETIVRRQTYGILPITDQVVATQQNIAQMYLDLGLIPQAIDIREVILPQTYYDQVFPKDALV